VQTQAPPALSHVDDTIDERRYLLDQCRELIDDDHEARWGLRVPTALEFR
jgi:hypothetical protein